MLRKLVCALILTAALASAGCDVFGDGKTALNDAAATPAATEALG
ncbi:MAG TPA: hypothetical protein P5572_05550 [Phycisphaerae bacterium]|nr:hypothetical protein [Phycisphaerae bacterium]